MTHQPDASSARQRRDEPPWGGSAVMDLLWRHKVLVVIGTVLGASLGLLLTSMQPTTYLAQSTVFLSSHADFDPTGSSDYVSDPSRYVQQQAAMMTSTPVLEKALEDGATADGVVDLRASLEVVASQDTDIVTVKATAESADAARARVNRVVRAYQDHAEARVQDVVADIEDVVTPDELRDIQRQAALFGDGIALVEPATAVRNSSGLRNAALLGIAALLLSLGLGMIRDTVPSRASRAALRVPRPEPGPAGLRRLPRAGEEHAVAGRAPSEVR